MGSFDMYSLSNAIGNKIFIYVHCVNLFSYGDLVKRFAFCHLYKKKMKIENRPGLLNFTGFF